jgi:NADH-quinone oxidoreductase subunit G
VTKIILNGKEVEADPTKPLVHACHTHGAHVPVYCYHPGLTPKGSCRMCQVEIQQGDMPARVIAACRGQVSEGMVVNTEAPAAHEARRQCLEFLLKDHPLDCPICDQAGECDLQDHAFAEGQCTGRSIEPRPKKAKRKSMGEVILHDEERCILCGRCVRFFKDIIGKPQLAIAGLAAHSYISTFVDRPLEGNYQGNVADVCPVGAMTLKGFRFQARVWNLEKGLSTCGECSRGCAITVEVLRGGDVQRLRPRFDEAVNRWWMCDTGRFSHPRLNEKPRLAGGATPNAKGPGARGFDAIDAADAIDKAVDSLKVHEKPVIVVSPWLTQEEGERVLALARDLDGELGFVSPPPSDLKDELLHTGDPCPNRRGLEELGIASHSPEEWIEKLGSASCALLIGEKMRGLLGEEKLVGLPAALRLISIDTTILEAPAVVVCIGTPNCAERAGTWINVDGIRRSLTAARPAPSGVAPLTRTLEALSLRLRPIAEPIAEPVSEEGQTR